MANYTFHNPSSSAYFVFETTGRNNQGFYDSNSVKYASGSFTNFTSSYWEIKPVGQLLAITMTTPGTNVTYPGGTYPVVGGTGTGATFIVTTTPMGQINSVTIGEPGVGYTVGDQLSIVAGNNDLVVNVDSISIGEFRQPIQSDYIWGAVIPPGTSSFDMNGAITVPVSGARFRGTGAFTVIITT